MMALLSLLLQRFFTGTLLGLLTTLSVMLGRKKLAGAYALSPADYWGVVLANWFLAGLVGLLPSLHMGASFFLSFMASALVSILLFSWLVHILLRVLDKQEQFLAFIIPWFWVAALQMVLALIISIPAIILQQSELQILSLPLVIWALFWMIRIARETLGFSLAAAIALMLGRMLIEAALGMLAGTSLILG